MSINGTSGESLRKSQQLAKRLREQILDLARAAGSRGITINEAERQIQDHKGHSVSPRFAEHVKCGALVRVVVGYGRSTKKFPKGAPLYVRRHDEETGRRVYVHWLPEFAPTAIQNYDTPNCRPLEKRKPESVRLESPKRKGELA